MSIFYEINLRNLLYVIKKSIIMFHIGIKKVSRPHQKPENPLFMRLPGFLFTIRTPYRQYRILREYNEFAAISRGIKQYKQILET